MMIRCQFCHEFYGNGLGHMLFMHPGIFFKVLFGGDIAQYELPLPPSPEPPHGEGPREECQCERCTRKGLTI